jgi:hypothetical protein
LVKTLIVTSGVGRVQRWGGLVEEIRPGLGHMFSDRKKMHHKPVGPMAAFSYVL